MPVRNALGRGAELVGRRCLLLFLGSPWSVLRAAEGPAGWLAPSAFGAGLTGLAVKLASVGAAAAAQREPRTSALRIALRRINDASFMVSLVPLGVMLGRGGSRRVELDVDFAAIAQPGADYHVFVTPEGESTGLFVTNRTASGFDVHEQQGGVSSIRFSYRVVTRRKDVEAQRLATVELPPSGVDEEPPGAPDTTNR